MFYLFIAFVGSIGWAHNESSHQQVTVEARIQTLVEGIITDQSMDIGITSLTADDKAAFQMRGSAVSNATIAELIEALNAEPKTSRVYLVSTEKAVIDGQSRRVFVMSAAYAAK